MKEKTKTPLAQFSWMVYGRFMNDTLNNSEILRQFVTNLVVMLEEVTDKVVEGDSTVHHNKLIIVIDEIVDESSLCCPGDGENPQYLCATTTVDWRRHPLQ